MGRDGEAGREVDDLVKALRMQPYVLAGGKSSRMGRDKAMITLGGKTLLARAVHLMMSVEGLKSDQDDTVVTIVGERAELEGAARAIKDGQPGCGPLGGMEAALRDLEDQGQGEWAFFVPVDMPFLTPELIDGLLREWSQAVSSGALACHVCVGRTPQPLVSLLHRSLRPFFSAALEAGQLKVTSALESALAVLALLKCEACGNTCTELRYLTNYESPKESVDVMAEPNKLHSSPMSAAEQTPEHQWFTNVNTPEDLSIAETFFSRQGSIP